MPESWLVSLAGGALIGVSSALLLLTHGRIAGISGITGGALHPSSTDRPWRLAFLAGLIVSGIGAAVFAPSAIGAMVRAPAGLVFAGLCVGFGTRMGSGCTSGHGVCGLSRFSGRSLVAVVTFMTTGAITVLVSRWAS